MKDISTSSGSARHTVPFGTLAWLQYILLRGAITVSRPFDLRGVQRFAWALSSLFGRENEAEAALPEGGKLNVNLADGYWIKLLGGIAHEPEMHAIMRRLLGEPGVCFLDCGANIGYWSVLAAETIGDSSRIIAVEASPPMFQRLKRNAELNNGSFKCVQAAVWSRDGESLEIVSHDRRHAGSTVVGRRNQRGQPGYRSDRVDSITIDTLRDRWFRGPKTRIIIKLDVEEAEIEALNGAATTLASQDVVIMYEDHGNDPACRSSTHMIENLGLIIYFCWDDTVKRLDTANTVRATKRNVKYGYNYLACVPGGFFSRLLESLT